MRPWLHSFIWGCQAGAVIGLVAVAIAFVAWAAEPAPTKIIEPAKVVTLTDAEKIAILTAQLQAVRVELAKCQVANAEKQTTEALSKLIKAHAAKGCTLREDLTCDVKKEPPR